MELKPSLGGGLEEKQASQPASKQASKQTLTNGPRDSARPERGKKRAEIEKGDRGGWMAVPNANLRKALLVD